MPASNHSILAIAFLLFLCVKIGNSYQTFPCHASCLNCTKTATDYYYTCRNTNNCTYGFKTTGAAAANGVVNCTPQARYTAVYDSTNLTVTGTTTTNTCTDTFYESISEYGEFLGSTSVSLWQSTTPLPHYFVIRVMVSIVFMNWGSDSNYMTVLFNSTSKKNLTYGSMPNLATGYCVTGRYGTLDTSDLEGSDVDINIIVQPVGGSNWRLVNAMILLQKCDTKCAICGNSSDNNCTKCTSAFLLSGKKCASACLPGYFQNDTNTCDSCKANCTQCPGNKNICTQCYSGYYLFPPTHSCLDACPTTPDPYYYDTNLNACNACDTKCSLCEVTYVNCSQCKANYFNLNYNCMATCPYPLIDDKIRWKCQDCEEYCVRMTLSQYIPSGGDGLVPLYFDVNFTYAIDWSTFNYSEFQSLVFAGAIFSTSNMNISYFNISSKAFRISIEPYSYAFIINQSVTITIRSQPNSAVLNYTSNDTRPFHSSVFNQSMSVVWTYLKPPSMTDVEYSMITTLSTFSNTVNSAFLGPGVQEIKKFGFLLLVLNSVQVTSCLLLLNVILPQNLYEGIRFFASLVFYDVPNWQAQSAGTKYFFVTPNKNLQNSRRLLQIILDQFSFRRTGFSGIFLFDTYWQIIMIVLCYLSLGLALLVARFWKRAQKTVPYFYSALNAFHQIAIMYFTITIVFEFVYFDGSALKWVSAAICLLVNIYYFLYQIKIYYVLLEFPSTPVNDPKFELYVLKYSYYLKYLRFDEQQLSEGKCSIIRFIVRPHNYHILSYIKKFLMMLTFPFFYHFSFLQISILIVLQAGELVRIAVSKPYLQRWRNISKLLLESVLLLLFVLILFIELLIVLITNQGINVNLTWAHLYFSIGWVCFGLIFAFNIGYFLIFVFNWYKNCTSTNRQILEESRRVYYMSLYNSYQEQHKTVSLGLLNQWVKKGNLNKRNIEQLPAIDYRIEYYQMIRKSQNYLFSFKNTFSISMDSEYNFKEDDSNIVPTDQLEVDSMLVTPANELYSTIHSFFDKNGDKECSSIVLRTFLTVEQKDYKFGEKIEMVKKNMYQEMEVRSGSSDEVRAEKIDLLGGFPINKKSLIGCTKESKGKV